MRIRSRLTPQEASYKLSSRTSVLEPTYITFNGATQACLPVLPGSDWSDDSVVWPPRENSWMQDSEIRSKTFRINDVEHSNRKVQLGNAKLASWINPTTAQVVRRTFNGENAWAIRKVHDDNSIVSHMYYDAITASKFGINSEFSDIRTRIQGLPSRQAELPARILARMEELHLSTTAIEARELPDLYKLFTTRGDLGKGLKNIGRLGEAARPYINKLAQAASRKTRAKAYADLMRNVAGTQLAYIFGFAPTIGDVYKINASIKKGIRKRTTELSVALLGSRSANPETTDVRGSLASLYKDLKLAETLRCDRVDGCHVIVHRPLYQTDAFQALDDWMRRYVGSNGMGVIWEVIPYSFAIDWFLGIDDVLDSLFLRKNNEYEQHYWTSSKYAYSGDVKGQYAWDFEQVYPALTPKWKAIDTVTISQTHYSRSGCEAPSVLDSIRLKGLNLYNLYKLALIALGRTG